MRAKVVASPSLQQFWQRTKQNSIQLSAKSFWAAWGCFFKASLFSLKKQKTKNPSRVMLPFSFWKPDFLVQEYSDSDEKKRSLCRRFPSSWEYLTAETRPTLSHPTSPWGNKPNSYPEGSWANCFIMTAVLEAEQKQQGTLSLPLEVAEYHTASQIPSSCLSSFHFYFFLHRRQIALVSCWESMLWVAQLRVQWPGIIYNPHLLNTGRKKFHLL